MFSCLWFFSFLSRHQIRGGFLPEDPPRCDFCAKILLRTTSYRCQTQFYQSSSLLCSPCFKQLRYLYCDFITWSVFQSLCLFCPWKADRPPELPSFVVPVSMCPPSTSRLLHDPYFPPTYTSSSPPPLLPVASPISWVSRDYTRSLFLYRPTGGSNLSRVGPVLKCRPKQASVLRRRQQRQEQTQLQKKKREKEKQTVAQDNDDDTSETKVEEIEQEKQPSATTEEDEVASAAQIILLLNPKTPTTMTTKKRKKKD